MAPMAPETDPDETLDCDLLARISAGDFDAFHSFYQRHSGRALAFARKLVHDSPGRRDSADDIVQEVFLAVWRRAGTYRADRGDVLGWLYTLTRNKVIDAWRRPDHHSSAEIAVAAEPAAESSGGELRLVLHQALARLRPDHRRAIALAFFADLSYEETAGRLALPVGTLKSRIRVGLREMRAILA
jgi:RNA polymerase sigma-70 factor, ECF subfamily